jgi:phosphatidylethanolamine/phosphatidyl-N-methylethanolamine N-methyltransferase
LLEARFPGIRVIEGDARDLQQILAMAGIDRVRDIVSGLPLLTLPKHARGEIIRQVFGLLPPEGRFIQFTYGLAVPVPRDITERAGIAARRAGWVLGNLPPAAIWLFSHAVAAESAEPYHPLPLGAHEANNGDRQHAA